MNDQLDRLTVVRNDLARHHPSGKLTCLACAHRCALDEGARGVCLVRSRHEAGLSVPWGYVSGVAVDPIEKKPFYHFLPGSRALSFGMLGCDFHCDYCQNWFTSQSLRDPRSSQDTKNVRPEDLVAIASEKGCRVMTSTYNEPLITSEWGHDVFAAAHRAGIRTGFVSNGHATPEVLDYLSPVLDAFKVDLKSFRRGSYRALGGKLDAVLATIDGLVARKIWVEVVTLVVPEFNDSDEELRDIARFLSELSSDIPWHVTAFHPDYKHDDVGPTPAATLERAVAIGREVGLRHVYAGNLRVRADDLENTRCPRCGTPVIERSGFVIHRNRLAPEGHCPQCGTTIAGVWC